MRWRPRGRDPKGVSTGGGEDVTTPRGPVDASQDDGRVRVRAQLAAGGEDGTSLLRHRDQDVAYALRHEP